MSVQCNPSFVDRRRCFWTTHPCGCGTVKDTCGNTCCVPGLSQQPDGTISSDGWMTGLMLNMLNTDERRSPTACGSTPSDVRGHWSESFIEGESGLYGRAQTGYRVGTGLRYIEPAKYNVRELESLIEAELTRTLQKVILQGLATRLSVEVAYTGNNRFHADISVFGPNGAPSGRVNIIGQRDNQSGFYWSC